MATEVAQRGGGHPTYAMNNRSPTDRRHSNLRRTGGVNFEAIRMREVEATFQYQRPPTCYLYPWGFRWLLNVLVIGYASSALSFLDL